MINILYPLIDQGSIRKLYKDYEMQDAPQVLTADRTPKKRAHKYFNQLLIANYPLENYLEEWKDWVLDDPLKDLKFDVEEEEIMPDT